jgi:hypothetical protein
LELIIYNIQIFKLPEDMDPPMALELSNSGCNAFQVLPDWQQLEDRINIDLDFRLKDADFNRPFNVRFLKSEDDGPIERNNPRICYENSFYIRNETTLSFNFDNRFVFTLSARPKK